jgi:hypothetical protein
MSEINGIFENTPVYMKYLLFIPVCAVLLASCSGNDSKSTGPAYTEHAPCSFHVSLPETWKLEPFNGVGNDGPACNYEALTEKGDKVLSVSSMKHAEFETNSMDSLYAMAIEYSKFPISSQSRNGNTFVLRGTNPETGNTVYWKRVVGKAFISDLYFDYPKNLEQDIAPYREKIAASFTGK